MQQTHKDVSHRKGKELKANLILYKEGGDKKKGS